MGIHELGHFLAAVTRGIHVTKFSIGFGPTLFKWQVRAPGPLAAWLAAWLAGWQQLLAAGWPAGRLTAWLAGRLPACLPGWLAGWPADSSCWRLAGRLAG